MKHIRSDRQEASKTRRFLKRYGIESATLTFGLIAINLIFLPKAFRQGSQVDPTLAGQLGDFVGGYIGTLFALISVLLLTFTLREQRRSNQQLSFESKYFELLRLHRENVSEVEVQGVSGRKLFVVLIREFRSILEVVRDVAKQHEATLTPGQIVQVAYYCLLFGTGPNSSRQLIKSLAAFDDGLIMGISQELSRSDLKERVQKEKKLAYVPFEGHQSRLGHYFRHLYQTVQYVDQQAGDIDKYQYVKTIRAQLSNHEQALLLLNSRTPVGEKWWLDGFIVRYRMVQNIPKEFFDPAVELDVSSLFDPGYFEWDESRQSTSR